MKFAKYLQDEVVPEWRKAYINYKQGKKHLKAIDQALDLLETNALLIAENSRIPTFLLETTDLQEQSDPSSGPQYYHSQQHQQQQLSTSPTTVPRQTPAGSTPVGFGSNASTPILSRKRGHARNYSTIIAAPSQDPESSAISLPNSADRQSSSPIEDDRSGMGGATLYDAGSTIVPPTPRPGIATRTDSTGSQFGWTARAQSAQILKNISRRFTMIVPLDAPVRTRSIQVDDASIDNVLDQLLPEERVFFQFLDSQLEMVNTFYREKELEAVTKLKVIKQQLYVANEWKRRYDDKMAQAEAEQGWYYAEWSRVRKGLDNLMRVDTAITEDVTIAHSKRSFQSTYDQSKGNTTGAVSYGGGMLDPEQGLRLRDLHAMSNPPLNRLDPKFDPNTAADLAYKEEMILQEEEHRRQRLNHKVARTRIKAALYEFYRSLEMIKNYKVLNHTGFAKILKKFDKTAGWRASKIYVGSKLKPAYFMTSVTIEDLIKETEDVFIDTFEKGHRRRGMAKLRIPDLKSQTHHFTSTRIGLYLGLIAPLMVQALESAFSSEMPAEIPYWDGLLLVYAGLFLSILFACLFGINMYVWAKSRINYKFIFEFDPRDNLDFHEYFELPIFLLLLLTLALYLDFGSKLTAHVATAYWPLILISITAGILFCPLPIAHFTSRRWFISSIGRILASGYYRVEFRDFFLADEMNSLSYSIEQFEFAICAYSQQWDNLAATCSTSQMWITPFATALPAWFRLLQCLRRYHDTREWFPHLLNAGKYTTSLINLFVYFSYRHYGEAHLKIAWIGVSIISSIYTFSWDIYMDWGLFRFGKLGGAAYGHPFLRQELVYSRMWVYYLAIVLDFLGRFSWVLRLVPMNINVVLLSFLLALLEVLRRWQWNFFRLENEHLNNCGQFRAIKDIPLPFHIRVEGDTEDEDEDDEMREEEANDRRDYEPHDPHDFGNSLTPNADTTSFDDEELDVYTDELPASPTRRSGMVRSSSSHSSFAKHINGEHAHGLSTFSGAGVGAGEGHPEGLRNSRANMSRTSIYSAASSQTGKSPYGPSR
ncbi:hypothetical protein BGZ98_009011, partial [Dissophora globulifera]